MRNKNLKYQRRHEHVLRWMLEHPGTKQYEIAKATGYSKYHLSRIINSPDFKRKFDEAMKMQLQEIIRNKYSAYKEVVIE